MARYQVEFQGPGLGRESLLVSSIDKKDGYFGFYDAETGTYRLVRERDVRLIRNVEGEKADQVSKAYLVEFREVRNNKIIRANRVIQSQGFFRFLDNAGKEAALIPEKDVRTIERKEFR